ncbi:methyl-accepting chemotaxis protein [Geomesophilobacter sediminis]|uniref:Methyl-accepting chemotaxis protein n=1 Tax=Geomesophilobacter sediminis TaxID=2798584 RepID=A0A8J7JBE4_9BACT|nr:HAMP domain-containing methyl-accepting chemotaxis protein [Geomesophilobacter sediminis]MBJ6724446.1 methyl-accepting chemotaxis protein [Geomesophilobacter sediminis]
MNWYRGWSEIKNKIGRVTVGRKILGGFLLVACIAGLSGIVAGFSIWDVSRRGELMYTGNVVPIEGLADAVKGYQTSLYLLRDIIIDKSPQEQNDHLALQKQAEARVEKGLAIFYATHRSAQAAALQKGIAEDLKLFDYFRDKIVELATTDRRDEAINIMRNQAGDVTDRLDANISKLIALNKAEAGTLHSDNVFAARAVLAASAICLSLGVAAALALGYLLSRGITTPLADISGKVQAISQGDLTARVARSGAEGSSNELDILSCSVDRMAETLHQVVARIADESRNLSAASSHLDAASDRMAQRAEQTATEINAVAQSGGEMNTTAAEIARNCTTAADNVSRANEAVASGRRIMQETIESMRSIGEHARETSRVVAGLGERSLQIGNITETIDDIADQTNLLALNAAIEAARAGENGRGFAVVADEVRALAARTSKATQEIAAMIKSIQAETRVAIAAMDKGVTEAEQGVVRAESTGAALASITATIGSISNEVNHIATAAEEQSSTVQAITGNIQQVTSIIGDSAAGTQEVATAASELHQMARELKVIVSGFNIDEAAPSHRGLRPESPGNQGYVGRLAFSQV